MQEVQRSEKKIRCRSSKTRIDIIIGLGIGAIGIVLSSIFY